MTVIAQTATRHAIRKSETRPVAMRAETLGVPPSPRLILRTEIPPMIRDTISSRNPMSETPKPIPIFRLHHYV